MTECVLYPEHWVINGPLLRFRTVDGDPYSIRLASIDQWHLSKVSGRLVLNIRDRAYHLAPSPDFWPEHLHEALDQEAGA